MEPTRRLPNMLGSCRNVFSKTLLSTLLALCLLPTGHAQAGGKWIRAKLAGNAVESYRKKYDVPGISVAIARNGKILYAKGFGWKNHAKKIKASNLTRYRIASVSKPVAAILALELVDKGKLKLDWKIRSVIGMPKHHNYTIRDLLSHQSGVRHYKKKKDPTKGVKKHYVRASDAMKLFWKDKLVMTPRSKFSYSTHAYTILAAAIEKRTGKFFWLHARERFLAWGLKDLSLENSPIYQKNRSQIYARKKGKNVVAKRDDISWKPGGGGMQSSATDLAKLGMMLADGKILKKPTRDKMWTQRKTKSGKSTGYGLGWGVGSANGRKIVAHSGSQNGANSYWRVYPKHRTVIVVLSNRNGHKPVNLGRYLGALVFASPNAKPIAKF